MAKPAARRAVEPNAALISGMNKTATGKPKTGVKAGLREGESRVTCILPDSTNQVLHDWAHTTGRTFRQVIIAATNLYIEQTISKAVEDGVKLTPKPKADGTPGEYPEKYAAFYDQDNADAFSRYFEG